VFASNQRNVR